MLRRNLILLTFAACAAAQNIAVSEDYVSVTSPDGRIEFRLFNAPPDTAESLLLRLAYSVRFNGKLLIDTSSLGYDIEDQVPLGEKLAVIDTHRETVDETYTLVTGKASRVRNHYNSLILELLQEGSQGRYLTIEVRAFDDGVAFRYLVPYSAPLADMRILSERTQFQFARDATVYAQTPSDFGSAYEDEYQRYILSGIPPDALISLPLLAEQPGAGWAGITEANIDDYPHLYLRHTDSRILRANLAPRPDGSGLAARRETPFYSPWRVVLIGDTPAELLESNIVTSLNPPSAIADTSWINPNQPGEWATADWVDVEARMDQLLPQFQARGMRGVMVQNILRDDQDFATRLRSVAAKAAEHRLMLALHDVPKPDGRERTYPNIVSWEAALTSEYAEWGARANPDHNVRLAFTRLLAGLLDYAPGGSRYLSREEFVPGEGVLGTESHHLALLVVFDSPRQRWQGAPNDFTRTMPTTWDETHALGGGPDTYIVIARRKGDDWYLGAINGWTERTVEVPLTFLGAGSYKADVYSDGDGSGMTHSGESTFSQGGRLMLRLAAGGGASVHFSREDKAN